MKPESRPATVTETPLRRHAAWLLVTLTYLYVFPYFEQLNNPNENARVWMTRAIVEHHVLNIDKLQQEWGWVNDKATSGRHVYSGKAPGSSFLGVPVLFVHTHLRHLLGAPSPSKRQATLWLRVFTVELPLCLFLFFFAGYVRRISGSAVARDLLVVGLGAGTLLYPYGHLFAGHAQAAALAFSGYMLLSEAEAEEGDRSFRARLAWAGFLVGACVVFEYQAVLVAAVLAAYAVIRHRRRVGAFFAGALPAAALGLYHTVLFGRPWRFPFGNVENPEFLRRDHSTGFHGLAWPKLPAIGASLFSPDYGLFVFSPILALGALCAIIGVARVRQARREAILALSVAVVMLLFLAGMSNWRAGWCVGPRYIATVAPFLIIPIAQLWPWAERWARGAFSAPGAWGALRARAGLALSILTAGLVIPSVILNLVSGALYPHYPTQLDNPVFDLAFPLLGAGFVPYNLGLLVGLPGLVSLAPLAAAALLALALGISGEERAPRRWAAHGALAVVIAALFLLPLSRFGRRPSADETHAVALVRATWEPLAPAARR